MANSSDLPKWLREFNEKTRVEVNALRASMPGGKSRLADYKEAFSKYAGLALRADPAKCLARTEAFLAESHQAFLEGVEADDFLRSYVRALIPKQVAVSVKYTVVKPEPVEVIITPPATPPPFVVEVKKKAAPVAPQADEPKHEMVGGKVSVVPARYTHVVVGGLESGDISTTPLARLPEWPAFDRAPRVDITSVHAKLVWNGWCFVPEERVREWNVLAPSNFMSQWYLSTHNYIGDTLPCVIGQTGYRFMYLDQNEDAFVPRAFVNNLTKVFCCSDADRRFSPPARVVAALSPVCVELTRTYAPLFMGFDCERWRAQDVQARQKAQPHESVVDTLFRVNSREGLLKLRAMLWTYDPPARCWYRVRGYNVRKLGSCALTCTPMRYQPAEQYLLAYASSLSDVDNYEFVGTDERGQYYLDRHGLRFCFPCSDTPQVAAVIRAAVCMADGIPLGTFGDVRDVMGLRAGTYTNSRSHMTSQYSEPRVVTDLFATDSLDPTHKVWRKYEVFGKTVENVEPPERQESEVWQLVPYLDLQIHLTPPKIGGFAPRDLAYLLYLREKGLSLHALGMGAKRPTELSAFQADMYDYLRVCGYREVIFSQNAGLLPLTARCKGCGHTPRVDDPELRALLEHAVMLNAEWPGKLYDSEDGAEMQLHGFFEQLRTYDDVSDDDNEIDAEFVAIMQNLVEERAEDSPSLSDLDAEAPSAFLGDEEPLESVAQLFDSAGGVTEGTREPYPEVD